MDFRYVVFGAGKQGTAAAYDLAVHGDASEVILVDINQQAAGAAAERINRLVGRGVASGVGLDIHDEAAVDRLLDDVDGCISAVPYCYNVDLSLSAIRTRTHMTDMGGNRDVVFQQFELNEQAEEAGVTIVPDCGMGPGLIGSLAAYGVAHFDKAMDVHIWDGGLPQDPEEPWNFALTFHINGLTNEYRGMAAFLRDGRIVNVPTFSEYERIDFPPLGELEAFVTSGGISTAVRFYEGKLRSYQNKTLRYPGHCAQFKAYRQLGLFDEEPIEVNGQAVRPCDVYHALLAPKITPSDGYKDICVIRVLVHGIKDDRPYDFTTEVIDTYDDKTGFTAMERLTGWHTAVMLEIAVRGKTRKGVVGLETAVDQKAFIAEIRTRGISVTERLEPSPGT